MKKDIVYYFLVYGLLISGCLIYSYVKKEINTPDIQDDYSCTTKQQFIDTDNDDDWYRDILVCTGEKNEEDCRELDSLLSSLRELRLLYEQHKSDEDDAIDRYLEFSKMNGRTSYYLDEMAMAAYDYVMARGLKEEIEDIIDVFEGAVADWYNVSYEIKDTIGYQPLNN